jgi:hypothetical protein
MRKLIYQLLGIFSILASLGLISILPTADTFTCNKIKYRHQYCTYGFFVGLYKNQCISVQEKDVVCEIIKNYTLPYLHSSGIVKNPNGSRVEKRRVSGGGSNSSARPNFSVINYQTKENLTLTNESSNSLEGIESNRQSFHRFLRDKNQTHFQIYEKNITAWAFIVPFLGLGLLGFILCFQKSTSPDEV